MFTSSICCTRAPQPKEVQDLVEVSMHDESSSRKASSLPSLIPHRESFPETPPAASAGFQESFPGTPTRLTEWPSIFPGNMDELLLKVADAHKFALERYEQELVLLRSEAEDLRRELQHGGGHDLPKAKAYFLPSPPCLREAGDLHCGLQPELAVERHRKTSEAGEDTDLKQSKEMLQESFNSPRPSLTQNANWEQVGTPKRENLSKMNKIEESIELGRNCTPEDVISVSNAGVNWRQVEQELFPRWFNPFQHEAYLGNIDQDQLMPWTNSTSRLPEVEKRQLCVLTPIGRSRLAWDLVWSFCLLYEIWITPLELVFMEPGSMPQVFEIASLCTLVFFGLDILVTFFTGYVSQDEEILDHSLIAKRYLKSWFCFDVVATLPWDLIFGGNDDATDAASSSRAARASKALKLFKMVKLVRLVKFAHHMKNVKQMKKQRAINQMLQKETTTIFTPLVRIFSDFAKAAAPFQDPALMLCLVAVVSHFHAPVWAALNEDWQPSPDTQVVFERYYHSWCWAFSMFTFRNPTQGSATLQMFTLEFVVLCERFILATFALQHLIFKALVLCEEMATSLVRNDSAMKYLKENQVSTKTQVQVLYSISQTGTRKRMQRHFLDLMEQSLPQEVQFRIKLEMWSPRLIGLSLIKAVDDIDPDFVSGLAQLVYEETYASKMLIFKEGDSACAAYLVLAGIVKLSTKKMASKPIEPFTEGMWLGERTLVNPGLRRTASGTTKSVSTLMVLPGDKFQQHLEQSEMAEWFQQFCCKELWKGICGRCGQMGDHFGDKCPYMKLIASQNEPKGPIAARDSLRSRLSRSTEADRDWQLAHDICMYMKLQDLEMLGPTLVKHAIQSLDQLQDQANLQRVLDDCGDMLSEKQRSLLTDAAIEHFKASISALTLSMLSAKISGGHHFIFLSHYKLEAGTEATLMRSELEALMKEDVGHPAQGLDVSVFLDSENLHDLHKLLVSVRKSHNLVVMLTRSIFSRPWCLLEIATAVRNGVTIVPVVITKPGEDFEFPDEAYYQKLLSGEILGEEGTQLIQSHNFSMDFVVKSIRTVMTVIALPYSPQRTLVIRRTELDAVLKQCDVREIKKVSETDAHHVGDRRRSTAAIEDSGKVSGKARAQSYAAKFGVASSGLAFFAGMGSAPRGDDSMGVDSFQCGSSSPKSHK